MITNNCRNRLERNKTSFVQNKTQLLGEEPALCASALDTLNSDKAAGDSQPLTWSGSRRPNNINVFIVIK